MNVEELNNSSQWGQYRDEILRLYREERWTLRQVSSRMREAHGLRKTDRQYKVLFSNHRVQKNQKAAIWATVGRLLEGRQGKRSEVILNGKKIPQKTWKRETDRNKRDNHSREIHSSRDEIIVQTPPANLDQDGTPTPWHLVRFSPEQLVGFSPRTFQEGNDNSGEAISCRDEEEEQMPISIPEEAMDIDDLGNLTVLSRRVRQLHMRGVYLVPDLGEADRLPLLDLMPALSHLFGDYQPIPKSPADSSTWESLSGIFEGFMSSPDTSHIRNTLYKFPTDTTTLASCSKTDMLNFLVAILMSGLDRTVPQWSFSLCKWLSLARHHHLLELLLSPHNAPLSEAFATSFLECLSGLKDASWDTSDHIGALRSCVELILSKNAVLSAPQINPLLASAIRWPLTDCIPELLAKHERAKARLAFRSVLTNDNNVEYPMASLQPRTVALLLAHGASAESMMISMIPIYSEAVRKGKDTSKEENVLLMCLSRGVHLDAITTKTMPLSVAEHLALHWPPVAELLLDWINDSISREVLQIYESSCDHCSLRDGVYSAAARELALLGVLYQDQCDLDHIRALLDNDTDPDASSWFAQAHEDRAVGKAWYDRVGTAADRRQYGFHNQVDRPVDVACRYFNQSAVQLLLNFGSSPPRQLSRAAPSNGALTTPETFGHHTWLGSLFPQKAPHSRQTEASAFMRHVAHHFLSTRNVAKVSDSLLQWAIRDEDEPSLRQLASLGVNLSQSITFFDEHDTTSHSSHVTPFLQALRVCSLDFAKIVWGLCPYLAAAENQVLGSYELVGVCSAVPLRDAPNIEKISFLLGLGATASAPFRKDDGVLLTPLQATLESHYSRKDGGEDSKVQLAIETCEHLIRHGADVDAIESNDITPLKLAAINVDQKALRLLIERGAHAGFSRPGHSNINGEGVVFSAITEVCRAPQCLCLDSLRLPYEESYSSLHWNKAEMAQLLIQAGACIEETTLVEACRSGCLPTVQLLLRCEVNVQQGSDQGHNLVEISVQQYNMSSRRADIALLLLDHGADMPEQGNVDGALWECLRLRDRSACEERIAVLSRSEALCKGDSVISRGAYVLRVEEMVEAGVDVNYVKTNKHGGCITPLIAAVNRSDLSGVLCLLENGADVSFGGQRALCQALLVSCEITQVLYNAGARPLWESKPFKAQLEVAQVINSSILPLIKSWENGWPENASGVLTVGF